MIMKTCEIWLIWFMIYSMIGWIYESIICSIGNKKWINRGFLNGPYCPIYGNGALIIILLLGKIKNPVEIFFFGALLCCSLEYVTSYLMEKIFHARWWDYSKRKWNIRGRICLLGAVVFGLFSAVLILILHPAIVSVTDKFSDKSLKIISVISLLIFLSDCVITIKGFAGFQKKLEEISAFMAQQKNTATERIYTSDMYKSMSEFRLTVKKKLSLQQQRMILSFPKLKMRRTDHNDVLKKIRSAFKNDKTC